MFVEIYITAVEKLLLKKNTRASCSNTFLRNISKENFEILLLGFQSPCTHFVRPTMSFSGNKQSRFFGYIESVVSIGITDATNGVCQCTRVNTITTSSFSDLFSTENTADSFSLCQRASNRFSFFFKIYSLRTIIAIIHRIGFNSETDA